MADINEPPECPSVGCVCDGHGAHESLPRTVNQLQISMEFMGITLLRPGPWQEPWFKEGASKSLLQVGEARRRNGTHNRWQ